MNKLLTIALIAFCIIGAGFIVYKQSNKTSYDYDCPDTKLIQERKDSGCLTDCPGVCGCDNQTYCNGCEATKNGIRVIYEGPCK